MSETHDQTATPAPEPEELVLEEDAPEPEADEDELEIGPTKYKVPKAIKEGWVGLQKSVQTEKETLKAREAQIAEREARAVKTEELKAALIDEVADIRSLQKQLSAYEKLTPQDWMTWGEQDPDGARKGQLAHTALQNELKKVLQSAQTKGQELEQQSRKTQAERLAAMEKDLPAKIKDWSPAKKEALIKVATENGFSSDELGAFASDWRVMSVLDKAAKYDQAVARAAAAREAAAKAKADETPEPEPTTRVRATGTSTSIPRDSDDSATWLKKRQAQLKARGARF